MPYTVKITRRINAGNEWAEEVTYATDEKGERIRTTFWEARQLRDELTVANGIINWLTYKVVGIANPQPKKVKIEIEVGVDVSCYGNITTDVDAELLKPENFQAFQDHLKELVQAQYNSGELHFDSPEWDASNSLRMVSVQQSETREEVATGVPVGANYYLVASELLYKIRDDGKLPDEAWILNLYRESGFTI